jgi:hypothetical protein
MLVSCSAPHCRKVFCSRPSCYKKLPIGLRINTWEGFVEWKRQLEMGLVVFVCPSVLQSDTSLESCECSLALPRRC